jgi:hypothetical protein
MKRRILLVISVLFILAGIFILVRIAAETLAPRGKGALQVTSNIKTQVFLDNKPIGSTPLCKCDQNETIREGEYEIKIVPEDTTVQPFTNKIRINSGVLTAIERTFLPGSFSSAYILTLEKQNSSDAQLLIASIPDGALISLDGESKGVTPITLKSLSASEHEVEINKQGFAKKTIRVRAVPSYKLILNILLGTEGEGEEIPQDSPTPPQQSPTPALQNQVTIKDTPTGFLRVREEPSTGAREIGRVNPGESYTLIDENASWFNIELEDGTSGWVSKTYAEKTTQ